MPKVPMVRDHETSRLVHNTGMSDMGMIHQFLHRRELDCSLTKGQPSNRLRRLALVVVLILVLFSLLLISGNVLVASSKLESADVALIADLGCGQCFRQAVNQWNNRDIERILLHSNEPRRLELLGAIPDGLEVVRNKLVKEGLPIEAVSSIGEHCGSNWDTARSMDSWLSTHRDTKVRVLCDRFASRRWLFIFDRCLSKSNRSRWTVEGVKDPRFDETNWWRRRLGLKAYFSELFRLAYARFRGEDHLPTTDWAPELYESAILK